MNPPDSSDETFLQRVVRWQDGSLPESQLAAFEQEMLASVEKRRLFAELQMRSMLLNEIMRREAYSRKSTALDAAFTTVRRKPSTPEECGTKSNAPIFSPAAVCNRIASFFSRATARNSNASFFSRVAAADNSRGLQPTVPGARPAKPRSGERIPETTSPGFQPQSRRSFLHRHRWLLSAAAVLMLAGILAVVWWPEKATASSGLAAVSYEHVAEWEEGRGPVGGQLPEGTYSLASGLVRLTMARDATITTLAGPARFDVIAPGNIRLHEGRLSAHVSNPDAGFTVLTSALTVHDRGTVFGVDVRSDGEARVSVLEGKVDVASPGSQTMQRIEQGGKFIAHPQRPHVLQAAADTVSGFEDLWPLTMGVDAQSNLVEFVVPRAKHKWSDYRSDTRLFLMPERQHVKSNGRVTVDILPGSVPEKKKRDHTGHSLTPGGKVNSYLFFFRPAEASESRGEVISGSVSFARPVLGIITEGTRLMATDDTFGHPRVIYRDKPSRGIEQWKRTGERDIVRISRDGRRVYFTLHATATPDEFRVLVSSP
ncbi:MAG TPA: FecR family protein [Verrucomicrobiales bacterium]|nr:FecR family protein [Verrucomicrobiales bacterium]